MSEELERNTAQRIVGLWLALRNIKAAVLQETGKLGGNADLIHPEVKAMMRTEALQIAACCDVTPEVPQ